MTFLTEHSIRRNKADLLAVAERIDSITKSKLIARNTLEYHTESGDRVIQLHMTPILRFKPDGRIVIDTGGYNTTTTRSRLRVYLPENWYVYTERGVLYLSGPNGAVPVSQTAVILPDGTVDSDASEDTVKRDRRRLDRFMAHVRRTGLPTAEQSRGDPWILGERLVSEEVAWDWIDNLYMTRTLYGLALRFAGLTGTGVHMFMQNADRRGLDATDLRRIRRYLRACVGMER